MVNCVKLWVVILHSRGRLFFFFLSHSWEGVGSFNGLGLTGYVVMPRKRNDQIISDSNLLMHEILDVLT